LSTALVQQRDKVFDERKLINAAVVHALDGAPLHWSVKVLRYETRDCALPEALLHDMQAQITAEINKVLGEATVTTTMADATAHAFCKSAAAIQQPGGLPAVQLEVSETAVDADGHLARTNNTLVVPGHMGEVAGLTGSAMVLLKGGKAS
jgi:hypothetical protein